MDERVRTNLVQLIKDSAPLSCIPSILQEQTIRMLRSLEVREVLSPLPSCHLQSVSSLIVVQIPVEKDDTSYFPKKKTIMAAARHWCVVSINKINISRVHMSVSLANNVN